MSKIYQDQNGNKLIKNFDGSFQVENRDGKRVTFGEFKKFLRQNPKAKNRLFD